MIEKELFNGSDEKNYLVRNTLEFGTEDINIFDMLFFEKDKFYRIYNIMIETLDNPVVRESFGRAANTIVKREKALLNVIKEVYENKYNYYDENEKSFFEISRNVNLTRELLYNHAMIEIHNEKRYGKIKEQMNQLMEGI